MTKIGSFLKKFLTKYKIHEKKILLSAFGIVFILTTLAEIFNLEESNFIASLYAIYFFFISILCIHFAYYLYRKVHLLLRYVFIILSFYLLYKFESGDGLIRTYIIDILNFAFFTSIYLSIIVILDFMNDFRIWFRRRRRRRDVFRTIASLIRGALVLALIGAVVYMVYSIQIINKRLDTIEMRFGGSDKIACNEKESIEKVKDSVVRIVGGEAEGSGFAIKDNGLILTNFHVIEFEPSPKVVFSDNTFETAEIKFADKQADLAIISVERPLKAIVWGDSDGLELTEEVVALGYPFGGYLIGDISINTGKISARRVSKEDGIEYIQIDGILNPGVSGGPLINICGEVVGVNTAGTAGLGLAISSKSARDKWLQMLSYDDPLADIQKITFEPNKSPLDAVSSFYNYLKIRKMDKAFALLSDNFLEGGSFENWKIGYESLLDTTVIIIEDDPERENVVNVKLSTKDLIDDEIVYKYFEGWWEVKEVDGDLKLWQPKIKEVKDPDWLWFLE